MSTCGKCGAPASSKCAKCHDRSYCSRNCQVADWTSHKKLCKPSAISISAKILQKVYGNIFRFHGANQATFGRGTTTVELTESSTDFDNPSLRFAYLKYTAAAAPTEGKTGETEPNSEAIPTVSEPAAPQIIKIVFKFKNTSVEMCQADTYGFLTRDYSSPSYDTSFISFNM